MGQVNPAIVAAARRQDAPAFGQLYEQYRRPLYGYLRVQHHLSPEDADDVVQEAFAKAWHAIPNTTAPLNFQAWLYRIATNISIDQKRRLAVCTILDGIETKFMEKMAHRTQPPNTATGESAVLRRERQATAALAIEDALAAVNPHTRPIIALRLQEISYAEIAQREGLTIQAVKNRIHRFRQAAKRVVSPATVQAAIAPVE